MRALALLLLVLGLTAAAPDSGRAEAEPGAPVLLEDARPFLTSQRVGQLKVGIAVAGAALLAWGAAVRPELESRRARRLRDALLLGLGLVAAFGWWNFSAFNHPGFAHPSDTYHYYIGSKYFPELGYQRLYLCTAVAEVESGLRAQVEGRYLRDLESNELTTSAAALEHPETCTSHFSRERWAAFRRDITWFRNRVSPRRWQATQTDHGYNATPVWTALGGWLANHVPATNPGMLALRLIDPLLLAGMWGAITLAFGWRAACVAALYWGTNYPAQYGWTGGSFLRQGWLVGSVTALCALRRGRPATAGALLALAIGLRIFPIFIALALGVKALVGMFQTRRFGLSADHRRLIAGALAAGSMLFAFSLVSGGGARAWTEFIADSRAHLATPLRNYVGLATVVAYDPATRSALTTDPTQNDPYTAWKNARRSTAAERRWIFLALLGGYLLLLARAAAHAEDWVVGVLGVGLIMMAAELTCYYSAGLLVFGLLWPRRPSIGIGLCALSAAGWWIVGTGREYDEVFTAISLASVLFIVWATLLSLRYGYGKTRRTFDGDSGQAGGGGGRRLGDGARDRGAVRGEGGPGGDPRPAEVGRRGHGEAARRPLLSV